MNVDFPYSTWRFLIENSMLHCIYLKAENMSIVSRRMRNVHYRIDRLILYIEMLFYDELLWIPRIMSKQIH